MDKVALLGSADGRIIQALAKYFEGKDVTFVCLSDAEHSDFLQKADELGIEFKYLPFEKNFEYFSSHDFSLVALCDYRQHVQDDVLRTGKFISIHASLLPSFKGPDAMHGAFSSGVKVSGVTVHWVTEDVDCGKIIAQYPVLIGNLTHFDEYEAEIYAVENMLYPVVIDKLLKDEVFDFSDLMNNNSCTNSCGGCGGCDK